MNNYDKSFNRSSFIKLVFSILILVAMSMLFISLVRKTSNGSDLSFSSFLNWLGNLNTFQLNINVTDFTIGGNWGLFDGFRTFLNIFTSLFGVIVYLFSNLVNLLIYVTQFIVFLYS